MSDTKDPPAPAGDPPWLRITTGVLKFLGGGLVALHQERPAEQVREPEKPADRELREELERLGIRTDHADTIRRAWTSPTTAPSPPASAPGAIPTLSFEEFAAAAAVHLRPAGSAVPSAGAAGASSEAQPETAGSRRVESTDSPASAPGTTTTACPESARRDPREWFLDKRLEALEAKCHEIQRVLVAAGEGDAGEGVAAAVASEDVPEVVDDASASPDVGELAREAGGAASAPAQEADDERKTVVQGPWVAGRGEGSSTAVAPPSASESAYDRHEQRVAALEQTLDTFGRMVEGLAARPRGKGPPPD